MYAAMFVVAPGLAAAQLPLPSLEPAPPLYGLYVGAGAGFNWLQNQHLINATGTAANAALQSRYGWAGVGSLGYALPSGLRFEIEGDYRNNQFAHGRDFGFPAGAGGREIKYGPMFNVLYDMTNLLAQTTGLTVPYFSPYIGVGLGYQWAHLSGFSTSGVGGFPNIASNDTYGAIAYQFILGGAMPIPAVRGLAFTVEYRFFGVGSRKYNVGLQATPATPVSFGTVKLGNDFNHALMFGLRYNFGQPPPPAASAAPTAPAPAPTRSYLVFFDWDKYNLTDRARQIIAQAAANSTKVQYTRIEVNGYTDTSGTPKYNLGLSIRRANAVKAELIKDGVPESAITAQGFGDTHLLVPTGPNVREAQNRRVEIIIH
jgi:outer membrane protein OmpA-like peptidoglycan-associated protein